MRLLVFPNSLDIGGSQLNAVELAAVLQQRGHEVTVFGPRGPLADHLACSGVAYEEAPSRPRVRPSPAVMRALTAVVRRRGIDLVHGYEWPPILEACYGPHLRLGVPVVGTVMSMGVAPFIPRHVPLVVGTEQIAELERSRRPAVHVLEPPVDTEANRPGVAPAPVGHPVDGLLVVLVSRLARELKREGILEAIDAVADLSAETPTRLVIVGDGPAWGEVQAGAARANRRADREVVTLVGEVADPRPWYAAADVVLGMGGSVLRGMAFRKPVVVQGERGFWQLLTPESLPTFLHQGWYGVGGGGADALLDVLRGLAVDEPRRRELGDFSRSVVVERFSLEGAGALQEAIYVQAAESPAGKQVGGLARSAVDVAAYELRRRVQRLRGASAEDDFNALPAQAGAPGAGR